MEIHKMKFNLWLIVNNRLDIARVLKGAHLNSHRTQQSMQEISMWKKEKRNLNKM